MSIKSSIRFLSFIAALSILLVLGLRYGTSLGDIKETIEQSQTTTQFYTQRIKEDIMFDEMIKLSKAIQWERRTIDGIIFNGPGILFHASLVSNQAGVVDSILYDGNSTAGEIMFDLAAVDNASDRINLLPGRYFKKGLYIDIVTNVESVTVGFLPIKE